MQLDESVTEWIDQLRAGDPAAAQNLWERYFRRLVRLARERLGGVRRAAADEEDVALSAFASFCRAVELGRFPQLLDRDGLWRLLVVITERKAADLARGQSREKHGGGRVLDDAPLADLPGREPTPEFAALVAEACDGLLGLLGDDTLRTLALLKLEGYANDEIAGRLNCALRTVERKLALIRSVWEKEVRS
jgi:DNA-directed RNA polymerase specialized sigma24 family protein